MKKKINEKVNSTTELDTIIDAIKQNKTYKECINIYGIYNNHKNFQSLYILYLPLKIKKVEVYWYYGPTGSGKTYTALTEASNLGDTWISLDDVSSVWLGYYGMENIILDDITVDKLHIEDLLKIIDIYPMMINNGVGTFPLLATKIWITSDYSPLDTYKDYPEKLEKLLPKINNIKQMDRV